MQQGAEHSDAARKREQARDDAITALAVQVKATSAMITDLRRREAATQEAHLKLLQRIQSFESVGRRQGASLLNASLNMTAMTEHSKQPKT